MTLKKDLVELGEQKPKLRPHLREILASIQKTSKASYAGKIVRKALRGERLSSKKLVHEAVLYADWESWERNSSGMAGLTDIGPLSEILTRAEPKNVVDVYVYESDEDWTGEPIRGDLLDTVTVEIPATSKGKLQKLRPAVYRADD